MTTLQTSIHGAYNNDKLAQAVARGEKFTAGGRAYGVPNVRGEGNPLYTASGQIRGEGALRAFNESCKAGIEYIIYSYSTPIAWKSGGVWYVVSEKFSPSTTKHQSMARGIIHNLGVKNEDIRFV